jgi:diadenosine tetraphosphate (Ap4A) HIT family hydrolase
MSKLPQGLSQSPWNEDEKYVIKVGGSCVSRTNVFPTTDSGHLLFIPKDKSRITPFHMSEEELTDCAKLILQSLPVIKKAMPSEQSAQGFNIGWNILPAGGQSIGHSHAHVIPRRKGDNISPDGSAMGVRGGITRVLPCSDKFYTNESAGLYGNFHQRTILQNDLARAVFAPHPVAANHMLIIPKREENEFSSLTAEEITQMVVLAKQALAHFHGLDVRKAEEGKGANIGWNVGAAAGQVYASSAIMDVIPRILGDVEKPRGGIAKIIPPAAADYYAGKQTGIVQQGDQIVTNQDELGAARDKYFSELTSRMQRLWTRQQGRMVG